MHSQVDIEWGIIDFSQSIGFYMPVQDELKIL